MENGSQRLPENQLNIREKKKQKNKLRRKNFKILNINVPGFLGVPE